MEVVVGTYEEVLVGHRLVESPVESPDSDSDDSSSVDPSPSFKMTFTDKALCGSVRAVAAQGRILASGGVGEAIHVYDLAKRTQVGTLLEHNGTITCLEFFGNHLFSGGEDGQVCVWKAKRWTLARVLSGHRGAISSLAIHPSGKLALSSGKDRKLVSWNLVRGRVAFVTNLKGMADAIKFGEETFAVALSNRVDLYDLKSASVLRSIAFDGRVHDLAFFSHKLFVCRESPEVSVFDGVTGDELSVFKTGHTNRVKCIQRVNEDSFVTASSDGKICLWSGIQEPKQVAEANVGCRITCLAVSEGDEGKENAEREAELSVLKRTRKEDSEVVLDTSEAEPIVKQRKLGKTKLTIEVGGKSTNGKKSSMEEKPLKKLPSEKGHEIKVKSPVSKGKGKSPESKGKGKSPESKGKVKSPESKGKAQSTPKKEPKKRNSKKPSTLPVPAKKSDKMKLR